MSKSRRHLVGDGGNDESEVQVITMVKLEEKEVFM